MLKIDLNNILKGLSDEVLNNPLSPINQRPKITKFDNSVKGKGSTTELGLKSIFRPTKDLPIPSLSDRPLPNIKEEYVSEEFTKPAAQQVQDSFDILDSAVEFTLEVVDEVYIEVPDIRNIRYPKEIKGGDFIGYDVDFEISFDTTESTSYVNVGIGRVKNALRKTPDEKTRQRTENSKRGGRLRDRKSAPVTNNRFLLKFNVRDVLINYLDLEGTEDLDVIKIPFNLTPVNANSRKAVEGKTESFTVVFDKGDLEIPRSVAVNRIVEAFKTQLDRSVFDSSKYLTHLAHFGDGNNKVITNWVGVSENPEAKDGLKSLVLKLYEPLPAEVQPNQKLWISKLQSEPIIETITLNGDDSHYCPPLQGPNFSLEVDNGIGYQIYDDLLASGSGTSTDLVNQYTNTIGIDTEKLSISYLTGSEYNFDDYVHFGSAEERIKNFWYKIELLETYQAELSDLTSTAVALGSIETENGFVLLTESGLELELDALSITQQTQVQAKTVREKINSLIRTFDGFEKFLYTSTTSKAYPKESGILVASTTESAQDWYNTAITKSSYYDKYNPNYLVNNVPEFLRDDNENEEFLLFLDMIGQHFDIIWSYINSISNSKKLEHSPINGIPDTLVSHMLESMGWDGKRAYDSQFLWEYALGQNKDGSQKYDRSLKDANEEIWRRILNNLPYLLKHKGTSRSLKAILATYGVPQSLLTIMEFGGPQDPTTSGTTSFTFEDRTASIRLSGSQYIQTYWNQSETIPGSIELNVKFDQAGNHGLVYNTTTNGEDIAWKLEAIQTTGSLGKIKLSISGSSDLKEVESSEIRLFNGTYKHIAITREELSPSHSINLFVKESSGDRLRINDLQTLEIESSNGWDTHDLLRIGGSGSAGLVGSIDEFRIWKTPLDNSVITNHTKVPDSINGNSYTASSTDLLLRHDFEYPKNRHTSGDVEIINVSISDEYVNGESAHVTSSIAVNFTSESAYPWNYESYERSVTAQVPSMGFNFADKIRFEQQTDLNGNILDNNTNGAVLSYKTRVTKKSFDRAPVDSPKLGLFFSPTRELNMDILKSMGNFNIDNYIGDPRDEYNDKYSELDILRNYYFERVNLNVQEYIQLVRNIDKSLFDVLADLVPARAKVAKGLLIEPHILERSKQKWERPTSEKKDYESEINVNDNVTYEPTYDVQVGEINVDDIVTYEPTYDTYDGVFDVNDDTTLESDYLLYNGIISASDAIALNGTYPTYVGTITTPLGEELTAVVNLSDFTFVGQEDGGFGLYASASHGKVTTLDALGNLTSSRQQIYGIDETYEEAITVWGDPFDAGAYTPYIDYITKPKFVIAKQPFGGTPPTAPKALRGGRAITQVTPLNGYFTSHYKFVKNHSEGFQRSFYKGSQQTTATTPDGLSPVETITTNPNILKVADTGRGSGEPILEVD